MTRLDGSRCLSGVIEGFYGEPWTPFERLQLFDWMAAWGLDTYVYAPKDDLHHRALWREPHAAADAEGLRQLIETCGARNCRFVYALSPGLDIRYGEEAELNRLRARFEQMRTLGCSDFALLFDDIPARMDGSALERWGSLASAQCHVANSVCAWLRERRPSSRFIFCPTAYCGRMAAAKLGGEDYCATVGRELAAGIDIFWTGPDIVSREITVAHVRETAALLRRKPLIWDNLHANDYDGRRFYCGPYSGRPPELRTEVSGLLSNPNCEFPLNYVPLRTLAEFVHGSETWNARGAYLTAMRDWSRSFTPVRGAVSFEDLVLFGDCYYLPHEEGPEAEALYQAARALLIGKEPSGGASDFRVLAARLNSFCEAIGELQHRPLFHALSRRTWELREELGLLQRFASLESGQDFHLPATYRGGMVARLERLLEQQVTR